MNTDRVQGLYLSLRCNPDGWGWAEWKGFCDATVCLGVISGGSHAWGQLCAAARRAGLWSTAATQSRTPQRAIGSGTTANCTASGDIVGVTASAPVHVVIKDAASYAVLGEADVTPQQTLGLRVWAPSCFTVDVAGSGPFSFRVSW